ncbi:stress response protein nst1 [Gigaspora margarita]|uniref:Stress response protein NST1 n=1 Tax=Gigaspora margarita TaxID=4874 RepID=A0A8H3XAI4_GIGMA|nr:stress response protein nst1 [Gigaspora margarita]
MLFILTAIEEELETFYDTYYEELELYANQQQQFGSSTIEYHNDSVAEYDKEKDDDDKYDDGDNDEDEDYEGSKRSSDTQKKLFNFGNSLTVKVKNDEKKFLEMMEQLAEHRIQREEEVANEQRDYKEDDDEYEENGEEA